MAKIDLGDGSRFSGGIHRTKDEWLDWCWIRNCSARDVRWHRWYLVRDLPGGFQLETLNGDDAAHVWAMLDDKPLIPYRWDQVRIRKFLGLVHWQMRAGMSPDAYMLWRGEGRERRRKEWIERETRLANPELAEAAQ